jgi:hypothetical protein
MYPMDRYSTFRRVWEQFGGSGVLLSPSLPHCRSLAATNPIHSSVDPHPTASGYSTADALTATAIEHGLHRTGPDHHVNDGHRNHEKISRHKARRAETLPLVAATCVNIVDLQRARSLALVRRSQSASISWVAVIAPGPLPSYVTGLAQASSGHCALPRMK